MKKVFCMIALAAITFSSVYAGPVNPANTAQQDSTKKKVKVKDGKKKIKMKTDTSKTKTKVKTDKKPPM
ncbi:MAG: hypothetical protein V4592_20855 [Bacteroidota bacterium]